MSVEITRAESRQRAIEPYLDHLRKARLDLDIRQAKGTAEWVDNVSAWVEIVSYLAGKNKEFKPSSFSKTEEQISDISLIETAAALSAGAHFPKLRRDILSHATDWPSFSEWVAHELEGAVKNFAK